MLIFLGVAADYLVEKKTAYDVKMFHRTESRTYRLPKVSALSASSLSPQTGALQ